MSANVETMFSVRETPWHGLGRIVMEAPASREALELAGLDWQVESRNIYSGNRAVISGYYALSCQEPCHVRLGLICLCRRRFAGGCCAACGRRSEAVQAESCKQSEAGTAASSLYLCPLQSAH